MCCTYTLLLSLITISNANAAEWVGFVIKVMDNGMHKGDDRIPYMIFPQSRTYSSRSICYSEFQNYFANDTRYPQTSDAYESYIYGCIKDRKRKAYLRGSSVKETVKRGINKGVEVGRRGEVWRLKVVKNLVRRICLLLKRRWEK